MAVNILFYDNLWTFHLFYDQKQNVIMQSKFSASFFCMKLNKTKDTKMKSSCYSPSAFMYSSKFSLSTSFQVAQKASTMVKVFQRGRVISKAHWASCSFSKCPPCVIILSLIIMQAGGWYQASDWLRRFSLTCDWIFKLGHGLMDP